LTIEAILPSMVGEGWGETHNVHDDILARAAAVTRTLTNLIPWAGYALSGWDAGSGDHRHVTLASQGYSDAVLDHMNGEFVENNPAFHLLHLRVPRALRWSDLRRDWNIDFPATAAADEFLIPSGYREGTTMCLRLPDGRYTGSLHVSWGSERDARDETRDIIEGFRPLLALVCDLLRAPHLNVERIGPDGHAALISSDGKVMEMPGRSFGPLLGPGGLVQGLVSRHGRKPVRRRYLWAGADGLCHRIDTFPCYGGTTLVTEMVIPWPFGLTSREAQVLHLVASGLSNPQIAASLRISPRTVSTHVEHLLEKLNCISRSQLAVSAVRANVLLLDEPTA